MEVLIKLSDAIKTLKSMAVPLVRKLPFAQPERLTDYSFEESCTECPAYDTENHRCPRFNQVIRTVLKDANLEPCENCISRQAAIDVIDAVFPVDPMKSEYAQGIACGAALAKTYVEQLPSEQPERMKGKWERHYCEDGNPDGWRCDNCDEWYYFGQTLPNFCPNCGSDMRGEQNE